VSGVRCAVCAVCAVYGARGVWCAAGRMRRTECFMYFSAHVLTHFSSVAVSALLRKETTHSLKHRSTSPLNMRSVSFSCISSSFCSIAAQRQGQQRSRLRAGVLPQAREAHPASQLLSPGPRLPRSRSCCACSRRPRAEPGVTKSGHSQKCQASTAGRAGSLLQHPRPVRFAALQSCAVSPRASRQPATPRTPGDHGLP